MAANFELPSTHLSTFISSTGVSTKSTHLDHTITLAALHDILTRVLEQTTALFQAQSSTNRVLDELRRFLPVAQENANIEERLRQVEALVETPVAGQGPDLHLHPSPVKAIGKMPRADSNSLASTDRTMHHLDPILHTNDEQESSLLNYHDGDVAEEVPDVFPSSRINYFMEELTVHSGRTGLSNSNHGSAHALSPTNNEDEDRSSNSPGRPISSCFHLSSTPTTTNFQSRTLEAGCGPLSLPPPGFDNPSTVGLPRSAVQHPTPPADSLDVTCVVRGKECGSFPRDNERADAETDVRDAFGKASDTLMVPDSQSQLPSAQGNFSWVAVSEQYEALKVQLTDVASLIRQTLVLSADKEGLVERQWRDGMHYQEEHTQIRARQREEENTLADPSKPQIEDVMEEVHRSNAECRELLNAFSDSWRADSNRQHEETINTVRATANEQVPYNVQGYLDEFSKALATEIRMLLGEVGELREERRNIQFEIGYLLTMQSTLDPDGEFAADWQPHSPGMSPLRSVSPSPILDRPSPRPAWRTLPARRIRRREKQAEPSTSFSKSRPSWDTWRPNPALVPTPRSVEPALLVPDHGSPGLFGPRSPPDPYWG